ncbi:NUDIX hydrolase [Actinacidiphila oryziradicis]
MDRIEAHLQGKWHRTVHCWVVSAERGGQILLQKRSDTMKNFPGLLDVSAAGHLEAGEPVEAGLREVTEELGIEVDRSRLHHLGERVEVADQKNGQRNREYQSVCLIPVRHPAVRVRGGAGRGVRPRVAADREWDAPAHRGHGLVDAAGPHLRKVRR